MLTIVMPSSTVRNQPQAFIVLTNMILIVPRGAKISCNFYKVLEFLFWIKRNTKWVIVVRYKVTWFIYITYVTVVIFYYKYYLYYI